MDTHALPAWRIRWVCRLGVFWPGSTVPNRNPDYWALSRTQMGQVTNDVVWFQRSLYSGIELDLLLQTVAVKTLIGGSWCFVGSGWVYGDDGGCCLWTLFVDGYVTLCGSADYMEKWDSQPTIVRGSM